MVATLLRLVGIDLKRLARETAITIVLVMLGAFAAMLSSPRRPSSTIRIFSSAE
jgi:hypothetical protein